MRAEHARRADRSTVLLWAGLVTMALLAVVSLLGTVAAATAPSAGSKQAVATTATLPLPDGRTAGTSTSEVTEQDAAGETAELSSPEVLVVRRRDPLDATPRLGRVGGLGLHQPSPAPVAVGFHEAATPRAVPIRPLGRDISGDTVGGGGLPDDTVAGWPYRILPSRGRSALPTTAVDVALPDGEPVLAPVSGEVVSVGSYHLEGRYRDLRVEIRPDAAPAQRVVVIHVDGVQVAPGDRVDAGRTPLARTARRFPFMSQIDAHTAPDHLPHVHIEVQSEPPPEPPEATGSDDGVATTAATG